MQEGGGLRVSRLQSRAAHISRTNSKGHVTDSLQLQAPPVVLSIKVPQVINAHAVLRLGIANQEAGTEEDGPQAGTAGVQGGGSSLGAALPGSKFKHLAARYLHPFYLDPGLVRQQLKLQQREVPRELGGRGVGGVSQDGQDAHGWDPELLKAEVQQELAQELHVSPEVVLTLLAQLESALIDWHRHQAPETLKGRLTPQDFKVEALS
ncbi:hypothetical protein QJQ45_003263 [Haematococcus lacustris]|nr:hypothetical protein QJQ45_003263 [Haematococcus lacustris]